MIMYVLTALDKDDEYEEMTQIIGIFSSKTKAMEIQNGKATKIFPNHIFDIEEWEVDDFSWEIAK